jgi:hypothetical protein
MDTYDLDDDFDLDHGPAATRPVAPTAWRSHWWVALVVLVVLALAGLYLTDQHSRNREFGALIGQVQQSQSTIGYADRRIEAMVAYTSPQLLSATAPERVRASLRRLVQQTADQQIASIQARRAAVARLKMARWHPSQRSAQRAYLAYLDYRIGYLRAIAKNVRTLYQPQPEDARRLDAARQALLAIAPSLQESDQVQRLLEP